MIKTGVRTISVSIIIPTFNGATRIGNCLEALSKQIASRDTEILVVNDGSIDITEEVVARYPAARLITQANTGPAAARNRGAREAKGSIILFTDDDCVPVADWLTAMIQPFQDPEVIAVKGIYRTKQTELVARFVQIEYEDRYRLMARLPSIDFIDTYSAGFRRDKFLEMNGYDTNFPVACAEDAELSYRMSARGCRMKFVPTAIVYHTHPKTLWQYLKKKYKFGFWRVLAVQKNPRKALKDSHTPQLMKLQLLLAPALTTGVACDLLMHSKLSVVAIVLAAFFVSTLPFAFRALRKDSTVGLLSPMILAARSCTQFFALVAGLICAGRKLARAPARSTG